MSKYRMCTRCVMDTTDPDIFFDENGVCNHCKDVEIKLKSYPFNMSKVERQNELNNIVDNIKESGKNNKYDCVIGLSGGVDSTYVAYIVKKLGLRPLAVHFDNGWNSELSVKNIENICKKLNIDLFTYVVNWEEFKDLQLSFLKASTPDSEVPSDHAIRAIMFKMAAKYNINYVIAGTNDASESILPRAWSHGHSDWKYINNIQKKFGKKSIKSYPHYSYLDLYYYKKVKKIKWLSILDYIEYIKDDAKKTITKELEWKDYGGKHYESIYTKFFQGYILPEKFGFDKRKAHLSSLIISGQITKEEALKELNNPAYPEEDVKNDIEYVCDKFAIDENEFNRIMNLEPKKFSDYSSYENSWYINFLIKIYKIFKH